MTSKNSISKLVINGKEYQVGKPCPKLSNDSVLVHQIEYGKIHGTFNILTIEDGKTLILVATESSPTYSIYFSK